MKRQATITGFFKKTPAKRPTLNELSSSSQPNPSDQDLTSGTSPSPSILNPNSTDQITQDVVFSLERCRDLGALVEFFRKSSSHLLSDADRLELLTKPWIPECSADFPFSLCKRGEKIGKRYLNANHLESFLWLAISKHNTELSGGWCKFCILFKTSDSGGGRGAGICRGGGQQMGSLVNKPLQDFSDLTGKGGSLTLHEKSNFHKLCAQRANDFLARMRNKDYDVRNLISTERAKQASENRSFLEPIIDITLTMAKQNIALRGHRDDGPIDANGEDPSFNDGNFRALVRLRTRGGDNVLQNHLKNAPRNATYTSKTIQNEILDITCSLIKADLKEEVSRAGPWSLLADETQDRAKREKLAIAVRYLKENADGKFTLHEDPISMKDLISDVKSHGEPHDEVKLSGIAVGESLNGAVDDIGLDKDKCVGQGCDGASVMASERVGAATQFQKYADLADYYHCMMHSLNLSASQSSKVTEIRHCMDTIKEACSFFKYAKRNDFLVSKIKSSSTSDKPTKEHLVKLCTTRFIERFTSVLVFKELLPYVTKSLDDMLTWDSLETRKGARSLLNSILKPAFIVSLIILEKVSAIMRPLSAMLQNVENDIILALSLIDDTTLGLQNLRNDGSFKFFDEACAVAQGVGITRAEMEFKPRFCKRSVFRSNSGDASYCASDYYRVNVLLPTLDSILGDLKLRFGKQQKNTMHLLLLLPSQILKATWDKVEPAVTKYRRFLDSKEIVKGEFILWKEKWRNPETAGQHKTALSTLNVCSKMVFPNLHYLLKILCVLPVTTAEPERFFSKLESTLTACRATMGEARLEALLLIQCHRNRTPSYEQILEEFANRGARRLNLII